MNVHRWHVVSRWRPRHSVYTHQLRADRRASGVISPHGHLDSEPSGRRRAKRWILENTAWAEFLQKHWKQWQRWLGSTRQLKINKTSYIKKENPAACSVSAFQNNQYDHKLTRASDGLPGLLWWRSVYCKQFTEMRRLLGGDALHCQSDLTANSPQNKQHRLQETLKM